MKRLQWVLLLAVLLVLGACSDTSKEEEVPEVSEDEKIGFSLTGESIEEAENIPETEKEEILHAFDTYITTFNEKDLEGYMDMISETPESFDKKEEEEYTASFFEENNLVREPSDITIVKYSEGSAQVFANLESTWKQLSTGLETSQTSKQVTVFANEDGQWKVKSVHSIGENPTQE